MKRISRLVIGVVLLGSFVPPQWAAAVTVVCTVNNGTINGSDSLGGQYPGIDDPFAGTASYSVSGFWHDATEYEWCAPTPDWFKDRDVKWNATAVQKLQNEAATRTIQLEQDVKPQDAYDYTGGHSSSLPYIWVYTADVAQQLADGYEDTSFGVSDPSLIIANVNYYGYLEWRQEADGGFLNGSPLLQWVETKITYGKKDYTLINYDVIGHWTKKVANNK